MTEPIYLAAKPRPKPQTSRTRLNALRRIRDAAIGAAQSHPNFVYGTGYSSSATCCYYPDSKSPVGCIVGHAARSVGHSLDRHGSAGVLTALQGAIGVELYACDRSKSVNLIVSGLGTLQAEQDQGRSWGEALASADAALPGWREA